MDKYVFVDSEISGKRIADLGAIKDNGAEFHKNSPIEFKEFIKESNFVVGHNIIHHDLQYIEKLMPNRYEAIDTLYLSPLLFPNRPYHNLVKDDKINSDDVNNPLSDSIKCKHLYYDEVAEFKALPEKLKNIYGELLYKEKEFSGFLKSVEFKHQFLANIKGMIFDYFKNQICIHSNIDFYIKTAPVELAYTLALITTEDKNSITPPWVLHNYPYIQTVINALRFTNCHDEKCEYCSHTFKAKERLTEFFGYKEFRTFGGVNLQEQAVELALQHKSLLIIFPTGGGKSITFQLPALIEGEATRGLTVVISPLQSLMKDQIDGLEEKEIVGGVSINGMYSPIERAESIEQTRNGTASILYIAPESLRSKTIEKLLLSRDITRFVIDEAHCLSTWGPEFRVDYLFIADFIKEIQAKKGLSTKIPITCVTATAKPRAVSDICTYFRDNLDTELIVLASDVSRTNLTYKVIHVEDDSDKYLKLRQLLQAHDCPTIIYVARVAETKTLAEKLTSDGIIAKPFNGQMERKEKMETQNLFMKNEVQVIVATSAFGMGVDKSDIKLVVHYDISDSLENYVQEAGRAGRDLNIQAECYILFNEKDLDKHFTLLSQSKITLREIQQVWFAIKSMTSRNRHTISASALEIARRAGWSEDISDVETRVRTAISALEKAKYIKRKMNSPRVFATGILVKSLNEAQEKINKSNMFVDETEKANARKITRCIIGARTTSERYDDAESRVDYISDYLGIPRMEVEAIITKLRKENIIADSKDLNAYIKKSEETKTTNIVAKFARLERYVADHIFEINASVDLKEFNDKAIKDGVKGATVKNLRTILFYWSLKELIKTKKKGIIYEINPQKPIDFIKTKVDKKLILAEKIADYLFERANKGTSEEELVEFSLLGLTNSLKDQISLLESDFDFSENDVQDALLYLSKINAINLDGGFIVIYNSLNIERLVLDNHIQYKKDDYKPFAEFYSMKIQQIHMVGEFANMMLRSYEDALTYVKDYFSLDYEVFVRKYFKGKERTGEILRNITPKKYNLLFGNLSEMQKKIIDDDYSQYISVIAGPGSGKTRVLVHKLASLLLLEDIKSEQLLMLTFSRSAAREFKNRLIDLVGTPANYVDIKTFHSYCFDLLGKIGNEEEFDNVVKTAVEMINSGEVEEEKITKTVLVIDEAQDINKEEYDLIKAIISRNPEIKIIAVGDDDQNIFEFRGSDSKYLQYIIEDYNAKKYEMVENYRSKKRIVDFANLFAKTIKNRIKTQDIVSMKDETGNISITKYYYPNLELPLCADFFSKQLEGTTAILTARNESALKVVGILTKKGIDAKLIQSDDKINLYNLVEFRYFIKLISECESPVVDNSTWDNAKASLFKEYQNSNIIEKVKKVIETFEKENRNKYKSDFISFVNESLFSDFETYATNQVIVSTIHKSKGREFDNVFILLDSSKFASDEEKRKVYVGLTRAKSNLYVHTYNDILEEIAKHYNFPYKFDTKEYTEPDEMEIQLGYKDIYLTNCRYYQYQINKLKCGYTLRSINDPFDAVKCSKNFTSNILQPVLDKGFVIKKIEVRYILTYIDKEDPEGKEFNIVLPNIYLAKKQEAANEIIKKDYIENNIDALCKPPVSETLNRSISKDSNNNQNTEITVSNSTSKTDALNDDNINALKHTLLFKELRLFRMKTAENQKIPAYTVATDKALCDITSKKPTTKEELLKCYGIGLATFEKYGDDILRIVKKHI